MSKSLGEFLYLETRRFREHRDIEVHEASFFEFTKEDGSLLTTNRTTMVAATEQQQKS
jgi:hypothetical protein